MANCKSILVLACRGIRDKRTNTFGISRQKYEKTSKVPIIMRTFEVQNSETCRN